MCGALAALFLSLLLAQQGNSQTYVNNQNQYYSEPGPPQVPQIDATAFDNQNIFSVTYNIYVNNQVEFSEPWWGTLFYTNNGEMILNAPFPTNGDFTVATTGVGFRFDLQEGNSNVMAGTFYNPGTIHCDSILDGNNLGIFSFDGFQFFIEQTSIGDCFVSATNIINPGNIVVGIGGQLNLNARNMDLTRGVLTLEQGVVNSNNVDVSVNSEGEGINTNGYLPYFDLTATNAESSFPDNLNLSFPTPYFDQLQTGPTNMLVRVVYIVNANTNVAATVYIAPQAFDNEGALIQWSGTFADPATGQTDTNYLYLYHYYPGSFGLTNLFPVLSVGTPAQPGFISAFNYLWSQATPNPGLTGPTAAGFQNIFNDNVVTNVYEFFNANLTGTTVATNASGLNPSGSVTNLPNRLVINASHELKMDLAQISGQNYMSLTATNQFDGSPGALISSPYSDINLGVTNGYPHPLTISNLLAATIPQWGGTLDEWSTRWTNTDASGISWDYRVMLVYANLVPAITPQVQTLKLAATNLVISDELNVFGSMFANATALTLTTNNPGSGATSPDGELNMQQEEPSEWSWNSSFPYLSWLTNDGAIRMPNFANIISSAAVTNGVAAIPGIAATNILCESGGANVAKGSIVNIVGIAYTFTNSITRTSPSFAVLIGPNFDASMTNLIAAINYGKGGGIVYSTNASFANPATTAGPILAGVPVGIANHGFVVTAILPGTSGNYIPTSTTATNLFWTNSASGTFLAGGVDPIPGSTNITYSAAPYGAIINNGLLSDQGSTIWVTNFTSGGVVSNGTGSFLLTSWMTTLTNCFLSAGGDVSLTANSLVASNVTLQVGRSLALQVTNFMTDGGVTNGNIWSVGVSNVTGFDGLGLIMAFLPTNTTPGLNNLLGSTISIQSPPPNKEVENEWAGLDYGESTLGYTTNNEAIGQLILASQAPGSDLYFSGPAGSTNNNAIYVDRLVLENYASLADKEGSAGIPTLIFNDNLNAGNLTIYYADAVSSATVNGGPLLEVSYLLNGLNNGHLVWVPEYTGYFSATNMVYPDGTTNRLNLGLATGGGSSQLDSNGNGIPNAGDSDPLFARSQMNFQNLGVINGSNELIWDSPPGATNFVLLCSSNFMSWNAITIVTNSPIVPPPGGWPVTNIVYEPTNAACGSYRVKIIQDNSVLYGQ